ncbi:Niemann-Pick C type protein [Parasponia andersonii]|uniref:Niemann-Pick C type protein n=1 Tax=Parasponia andersonii TaxID=3476 RepID=A0A2P5CYY9_PARAD|nr:Niemann-Pick C type protein [Parasponia andersonii]
MISFSASAFLRSIYLLQVVFITYLLSAEKSVNSQALPISDVTFGDKHSKEYCAMYDICGERSDGKVLNCPYGSSSLKPDELFSAKIQSLCPTLSGNVCCTEAQFDTLRTQVQQAIPFLVGCPACLRNFLNLFCELSCSPNQSQFINVTSTSQVNGNSTVDGIDYFISDSFGEGLFNSCKDVKFGTMNTRAIEFIGAGAKNFKEWFAFIGQKAPPGFPGSPYSINFKSSVTEASGMDPMNVSVYSCADTSLGCSCGDCPLSPACSSFEPPSPSKEDACSIKIGPLKVRCIELSVAILYILLVSAFLGWGFSHRTRERRTPSSSVEPLLNVLHDETDLVKGDEKVHRVTDGIQLSAVQHYLSNFFRAYGAWVARNPSLVLCSSLAIIVVFCLGLVRFNVETQPEKMKQCPVFHGGLIMYKTSQLWVGPGSRAAEEKQFFDSHLAPFYRIEQLIIATIPDQRLGKRPSIVTEDNIQLLFEIQKKVDGIRANHSGLMVSLTDICMKPLGQDCATQSILQYFKMDPENYDMYGGVEHAEYCFQHYSSADTCLSAFKAPLDPSTALGGFPGNNYSEASAFVVTYPVNNAVDKVGGENGRALAWEKAFIKLAKEELLPLVHSSNLTLSFSSESSIEEELKRESTADVITIVISYLVMFAYISVTLGDASRLSSFYLSSKVLLGLSGVVLVLLSVLGSVGLFSALGVKSTLIIMEVIPFLVLAVGVDNMCILVHAVKRQSLELSLEQRISNALVEVGPSITLASLSEILAFAVGGFISMPACRVFSMFAALAVLLNFFLQVTAFVALIVLDFSRAEDNRIDCFPCIKIPSSSMDPSEGSSHGRTGLLTRYMEEVHSPILGIWAVKMVVIAVFLAFTLASIALSTRIEPGLEQQIVLPRDSYLQGYFNNISEYLRVGPPLYFVVKNFNYSSQSRQTNKLCSISGCDSNSLLNEISRASLAPESSYIAKPAASWLDDFLVWMSPEAFGCCRKFINGSYCPPDDQPPCCTPDESPCGLGGVCKDCTTCFRHSDLVNDRPSTVQFMEKLPWFLNALPSADCAKGGHGAYTNSVDLNGYESGIIQASEFRTYHTPVNKQVDYVNSLRAAREFSSRISASLKMPVFPYSVFYIFFEQYLDIWRIALTDIALALGAIFIVCLLITSSLWSSLIILLILAMIVVDLMGVMAILDIQLNAVSVVNLIMSIGIAVEFCVHIMHAYLVSHGDRNHRMKEALRTMGASVFSGITLTKLVGVIVLCFARSEIFVVFEFFSFYLSDAFDAQVDGSSSCLGFAGLLLSDVPGIGSHWFLARPCIFTCGIESIWSNDKKSSR